MPDVRRLWPCLIVMAAAFAVTGARGQQDLDAGKTGPQLFSQDCSACHRSPQGLAKTSGGSLVSFLRQHYTSSAASANAVAAYLQAAGPGRVDRAKDQKGQPKDQAKGQPPAQPQQTQPAAAPPPDRARIARPSEPIPSVAQPEPQPPPPAAHAPGAKKRERLARPADPAANPQAPPQQGRRKARRAGQEAPAAAAPVPEVPAYPPPPPNLDPAGGQAGPSAATSGGTEVATPKPAGSAQPSFVEPLP